MTARKKQTSKSTRKPRPKAFRARRLGSPVESQRSKLLIVGIGASAGGLKAFELFFSSMPSDSGMAFILVPHLDPSRVSMLPELLKKYTEMPLLQADDGTKVKRDTIYIIPPNKKMAINHGSIVLTEPTEPRGLRLPIDGFFRSLAEDQGSNAIGIILSGTGTDGTMGLKAIKDAGGLTIAEDLASAEFDGMPRSAIESGMVDYVLAPEKIPEQILNYAKGSRPPRSATTTALLDKLSNVLEEICDVLQSQTGHDFSSYKKSTVCRRIARRMSSRQIQDPADYLRLLEQDAQEVTALSKNLLISVTNFFRDPAAFKALGRVLKDMLAKKPKEYTVRVWVPGCASGEEVYSIGILLRECMDALKKHFKIQIFGTDIDADAIETARAGIYPITIANDVAPARLKRFFLEESDGYHIKKEIREMAIFSIQDLVKDPPFTRLDLLSCRNVFIYLDHELQKRLLRLFHYALRPDGILFLGASESIGGYVDLFTERNRRWKIFKRKDSGHAAGAGLPFPFALSPKETGEIASRAQAQSTRSPAARISGVAEKLLLDRYAPTCVLINKSGEILYTHGSIMGYLTLPQGQASLNILAMARGRLKNTLATLIRKARTQKRPASVEGVQVKNNGKIQRLNLTATRYQANYGAGELLLITFEDSGPRSATRKGGRATPPNAENVARLEQELWTAREQLQSAMAERQSPDEELRSYNEELQSANEELQSMNEELETSKEELQSLNEELATVNAELQGKSDELAATNDDLRNLLDSTNVATLFLDTQLCVKRFTPEAAKLINLIQKDVGRPVSHFKTKFEDANLAQEAQEVLDTLVPKQSEIRAVDGQWYLKRVTPYRAANNVIDGVVVTFVDITERKASELAAVGAREFAQDVVETVREPLVVLDRDMKVVSANAAFYRHFKLTPQLAEGRSLYELNRRQWDVPELRRELEKVLAENKGFDDLAIEHNTGSGPTILLLNALPMRRGGDANDLILLAFEDVTDRERRTELRALAARLHAAREEERSLLAREIHDELSGSLTALKMDLSLLPDRVAKDHHLFLQKLSSMSQLIDNTLARVRTIVTELRPVVLDKFGLVSAIEWQARDFQERSGTACETHLPIEELPFDHDRATALFRILQEALSNVARHAEASKVVVDLTSDPDRLTLTVRDDGKGIADSKIFDRASLGLLGMRERAMAFGGTTEIIALPERGTCVTAQIPTG